MEAALQQSARPVEPCAQPASAEPFEKPATKQEMCAYLGIGVRALERWMKAGYIPFTKIDRIVRFYRSDVDAALREKFGQNYRRH